MNQLFKKLASFMNTLILVMCVLLTLATVGLYLYTSFYARSTGDDLGFAYRTHRAWESTHSFSDVWNAAMEEVADQRDTCASDFTMIFL